jgi:starch synthase
MSLSALSVASEIYPLVKTGGLADVAGALPLALAQEGIAVRSLVPGYPEVLARIGHAEPATELGELFGGAARLLAARVDALDLLVLDAPHLYARPGNIYMQPDNAFRFGALGLAATRVAEGALGAWRPDVVHAHDWQAGLAPAYLHYRSGARPGTVMTVHNLAFQGEFPPELLGALRLPPHAFGIDGVEYYGAIGFLKAGLRLADRVTTVSPSYAAEIRTDAGGMGLGGLLRARGATLSGILNGIDAAVWNPATDRHLAERYDADTLDRRAANKRAVQQRFGLAEEPERLLFGVVGRLTWQKGGDLLLDALPALGDAQLALLGTGEPALEAGFANAGAARRGRIGAIIGYDEALAHLIQGGCDALLVPSRFEPCGLTQLCALRYGTLPVVARTGGLADTVIDANEMALAAGVATGVQFAPVTREMLETALARTAALWRDAPQWRRIQRNAMAADVSWSGPASRYAALYRAVAPR